MTLLAPLLAACLAASSPTAAAASEAEPARRPPVVFHGNGVLQDEVYLAFLRLPETAKADPATAASIRGQLTEFLHQIGYELAVVEVAVGNDELHVFLDEGLLGKIILRGQAGLETVEARIALDLPHKVFNRPQLERQIAHLKEQFNLSVDHWELVSSGQVEHVGPQLANLWVLDELGQFFGHRLIPPHGRYDLQITLHRDEWRRGLGIGAGLDGADGALGNLDYKGSGLLLAADRWIGRLELGTKLRSPLAGGDPYLALTRGLGEMNWRAPALALTLRPGLDLSVRYSSHQRPDLPLESYRLMRMRGLFSVHGEPRTGMDLWLGAGMERLNVFDLIPAGAAPVPPGVNPVGSTHPVFQAGADFVFDPDQIRADRRHELHLEALHYPGWGGERYGVTHWDYQKVFELGWHDLWVTSSGRFLWGQAPFVEESSVGGSYVRGVFADRFYSPRAGGLRLEGRFSLVRDIYKLAVFHDAGLFEDLDRGKGLANARFVDSFGVGLCALVADAFQLDVYYALGFAGRSQFDRGLSLSLRQAF